MEIIKDRSFLLAEKYVNETGLSVYLTGKAGTGKTTFLKSIVQDSPKRCAVVAPTGVAAINAGGVTIHSFFQLPLCPYLPDVKELVTEYQLPEKANTLRRERIHLLRSLDLLIIDEISMVRADILDAMDYILRRYRRNDKPFGGVQLLMIGDVQQLPPVVKEEERKYFDQVYPSAFFFNSKALQRLPYITLQLEKVHRQNNPTFVDVLNDIRGGSPTSLTLNTLNERYNPSFEPPETERWIRLTTHNMLADSINLHKMEELEGEAKGYDAVINGNFPESSYPAEEHLELKVGTQVMFLRNDPQAGYYNGKIGTVTQLEPTIMVRDEEDREIEVKECKWENVRFALNEETGEIEGIVEGFFVQIPLRHAWAITIHKSQGLTFDKVIIDAGAAFSFGQVYVALSRCRSLEGIVLSTRITRNGIFSNDEVNRFEASYTDFDSAVETLEAHKRQQFVDRLCDAFNLDELRYLYNRVNRIYQTELPDKFRSNAIQFQSLSEADLVPVGDLTYAGLKSLKDSAGKFRMQLQRLALGVPSNVDFPSNEIKQRIAKGAVYYSDQLTYLAQHVIPLLDITIANKETKKAFNEAAMNFSLELKFRVELYSHILLHCFNPEEFLKRRTLAEIKAESTLKGRLKALFNIVGKAE